jgi:hypothetical protein
MSQKLYINKIIPTHTGKHGRTTCLFAATFTPNRYLYCDVNVDKFRKIPYRKKSITGFVDQKQGIVEQLFEIKRKKSLGDAQQTLL